VDIRSNIRAMYKLKAAAESAKHTLSTNQTASIQVESLHEGMDFQYTLSRCVFCVHVCVLCVSVGTVCIVYVCACVLCACMYVFCIRVSVVCVCVCVCVCVEGNKRDRYELSMLLHLHIRLFPKVCHVTCMCLTHDVPLIHLVTYM